MTTELESRRSRSYSADLPPEAFARLLQRCKREGTTVTGQSGRQSRGGGARGRGTRRTMDGLVVLLHFCVAGPRCGGCPEGRF
jgi:hypothetical protein